MGICPLGGRREIRVVFIGIDGSGKTSLLNAIRDGNCGVTSPTVGFNFATVRHDNTEVSIWDTGGHEKIRDLWRHYYDDVTGVVFVVDASDEARLEEAHDEMQKALRDINLKEAFILILANKCDREVLGDDVISSRLNVTLVAGSRRHAVISCSATKRINLDAALDWMTSSK